VDLRGVLAGAAGKAGGALAVVSGRTIATLDRFLGPTSFPAAGVHGAELRLPDGELISVAAPRFLDEARRAFSTFASSHPRVRLEDKGVAVALHFRGAPELETAAVDLARAVAAETLGEMSVQLGKMVVELGPARVDKGRALATLMEHAPFRGRRPVAVGDDLTDESMFVAARMLGGMAVRVGADDRTSAATAYLADPSAVRGWLAALE
jgi:trehalose 6-phosphate phosphatase